MRRCSRRLAAWGRFSGSNSDSTKSEVRSQKPARSSNFVLRTSLRAAAARKEWCSAEELHSVDEGHDDRDQTRRETAHGDQHVVAALAAQRIEQRRREVATGETTDVGIVVDVRHEQPEDDGLDDHVRRLLLDAAARSPAVVVKGSDQSKNRRRRSNGHAARVKERDRKTAERFACD